MNRQFFERKEQFNATKPGSSNFVNIHKIHAKISLPKLLIESCINPSKQDNALSLIHTKELNEVNSSSVLEPILECNTRKIKNRKNNDYLDIIKEPRKISTKKIGENLSNFMLNSAALNFQKGNQNVFENNTKYNSKLRMHSKENDDKNKTIFKKFSINPNANGNLQIQNPLNNPFEIANGFTNKNKSRLDKIKNLHQEYNKIPSNKSFYVDKNLQNSYLMYNVNLLKKQNKLKKPPTIRKIVNDDIGM